MTGINIVIMKRNGEVQQFDSKRIYNAINKSFLSVNLNDTEKVMTLTSKVVQKINLLFGKTEQSVSVEQIQDIVEQTLMEHDLHRIARNYILYREQHTIERQKNVITQVNKNQLMILKENGEKIIFNPELIRNKLISLSTGLKNVSIDLLLESITKQLYNEIPEHELNQVILNIIRENIDNHYDYSSLASRKVIDDQYQFILSQEMFCKELIFAYQNQFEDYIKYAVSLDLLDSSLASFNFDIIKEALNPQNDLKFHYLGIQILLDRYFIKNRDVNQKIIELPQWFWMRVAMGLAKNEDNKEEKAIEFYTVLSNMDLVSSTPTLFNSGTCFSQMSSCYLNTTEDSLESIFKLFSDNAKLSKWAGGIGSDWSYVRATGSQIKGTNGTSQGIIPFIKIFNDVALAVNQGGKRKGAMCAYLEIWHQDIEQFFELRKNTGDERRRTHDINTACWINDLFMKRVLENKDWTLFCPSDTPDLHDLYGKAFEERYTYYEQQPIKKKTMNAKDLWRKLLTMLYETGHPWVTFKDPCNVRSPQDHAGVVHSSNLCTEITLNTSKDETAVCNLASINLSHMITNGKLDEEKIKYTVNVGIRMLDNVIDNNYYPTKEAENANLKHRAVGLGIMGYQDALYQSDICFESEENLEFADASMEMVSYYAIQASSNLAVERGSYESYKGSKWDRGIFPLDTLDILESERGQKLDVDRKTRLDWDALKGFVKENGLRNSNLMAIAPTATIANISGVFPCTEPAYKNLYMKENLSGNFLVTNRYLTQELEKLGMWNADMVKKLKLYDGSLKEILEIPEHIRNKFKETFEIDMEWLLRASAKRMKWIDQSASTNVFLKTQSGKILSETYLRAWELGLKTTYYLRTLAATQVTKTVQAEIAASEPVGSAVGQASVCSILDPSCEACQ